MGSGSLLNLPSSVDQQWSIMSAVVGQPSAIVLFHRNALRQISRLVNRATPKFCDIVTQKMSDNP